VTVITVPVPTVVPLTTTVPFGVIVTTAVAELEVWAPNVSETERVLLALAAAPAVPTVKLHGVTSTRPPVARGELAGKVELVTVKMQEPNVVTPEALAEAVSMLNAGVADEPESVSVTG